MYAVSNRYKEVIYSGDSQNRLKLLFNGVEYETSNVKAEKLTITSRILSNGDNRFSLDNFVSKEAELIIHDIDLEDIIEPISISIGTLVDNDYEYVPIGVFKLDSIPTTDSGKTTIKLRDYSVNFDVPYNAQEVVENHGGSATLLQVLQDICTKCNVTLGTQSFLNDDISISVWDNSINARVYIMYIAEMAGCIATMSRTGELIFVNLKEQSYSGKNLLEPLDSGSKNGLTFSTNNKGITTISGTATNTVNYFKNINKTIPSGTYTLSVNMSYTPPVNTSQIILLDSNDNRIAAINLWSNLSKTFVLSEDTEIKSYYFYSNSGVQHNGEMSIQLEKNTTATSYEPYNGGINKIVELNPLLFEKYTEGEKLKISRVVYEDAIRKFEFGNEDYGTLYINGANPYVINQEEISNVYDSINDFEMYSMNISKMIGNPAIDPWDILQFTYNNKTYKFLGQNTLTFTGNIMQSFDTQIGTNAKSQENVTVNSQDSKFKRVFTRIDQAEGNIELNASQISNVQTDLQENHYSKEQTEQLILNAETGITNTFIKSGGNNIFRNTGLWFENTDSQTSALNPYEFWSGKVKREQEENASNSNALYLQNDTLFQEVIVPNGNYTVSFQYKKLQSFATVKCIINDVEYTLTETTDTKFEQSIIVTSQHIKVQFINDTNDGCEIYDLMVNVGEVGLTYSQNQNETTTDTVNISKGITISSSDLETTFRADADGIRTLDKNGNVLTKFTDTGMTNKTQIIEKEATIVDVLIQRVGNHTWFTKLDKQ